MKSLLLQTEPLALHHVGAAFSSSFNLIARGETPLHPDFPHARRAMTGAIYTMEGRLVRPSVREGGFGGDHVIAMDEPVINPPVGTKTVSGRSLWLGPFHKHYGHFLTEFLSRTWPVLDDGRFDQFVCTPFLNGSNPVDFQRHLLKQVCIDPDRVLIVKEPVFFSDITVPEQGWVINSFANIALRNLYKKISNSYVGQPAPERVFLSRGNNVVQRIKNVPEIESVFASRGFMVVTPEDLSISEQMAIYANSRVICGLAGSAMHNAVFFRSDAVAIEIGDPRTPNRPHKMQEIVFALANMDARFISYKGLDGEFDIDHLEAQLMEILDQ